MVRQSRNWKADTGRLIALLFVQAVILIPFVFRTAFGERDSYRVLIGLYQGLRRNYFWEEPLLYNGAISYGYYTALRGIHFLFGSTAAEFAVAMNFFNALLCALSVVPLWLLVRRLFGPDQATIASLVLPVIPAWWFTGLYGHAMTGAVFFLLLAAFCGVSALDSRSAGLEVLTCILLGAALAFRMDVLLIFPALGALPFAAGLGALRAVVRGAAWSLAALGLYYLFRPQPAGGFYDNSVVELILHFHNPLVLLDRQVLQESLGTLGSALNPLALAALALAWWFRTSIRWWQAAFLALGLVPNILFWLPNFSPPRHFLYSAPFLAIAIARIASQSRLARRAPFRLGLAIATAMVVTSIAIHHLPDPVNRFRSLFLYRFDRGAELDRLSRVSDAIAAAAPLSGGPVLVVGDGFQAVGRAIIKGTAGPVLPVLAGRAQLLDTRIAGQRTVFFVTGWDSAEVRDVIDGARYLPEARVLVDPNGRQFQYDGPRQVISLAPVPVELQTHP